MSSKTNTARPLPLWLKAGGSAFALWHILAVGMLALAHRSGPWPAPPPIGVDHQEGPQFAKVLSNSVTFPTYIQPLRMTNNYHFVSNEPGMNALFIEVHLKNEQGVVFKTLKFPDDKANFWVRHRQNVVVRGLAGDQPVQVPITERLAPAGQSPRLYEFWEMTPQGELKLSKKPGNQVPVDRNPFRPSDGAKVLAESYMRHLCKKHNAASAELVRHHRDPVMPVLWFLPQAPPPETFLEIKSYFGEYRRD